MHWKAGLVCCGRSSDDAKSCVPLFRFVQNYEDNDIKSHKGYNLSKMTMADLYKDFKLDVMTIDFIGHALALYRDDNYMQVRDSGSSPFCHRFKVHARLS